MSYIIRLPDGAAISKRVSRLIVLSLIVTFLEAQTPVPAPSVPSPAPAESAFRLSSPAVIPVPPDADLAEFPKVKKEISGNEDSCPLCKVLNGIYRMEPHQELAFPCEIVKPSSLRIRLYAFGKQPEEVIAELYQEDQTQPVWTPTSFVLEPGVSTISGSRDLGETELGRGVHWKVVVRNGSAEPVSMSIIISTVEMIK